MANFCLYNKFACSLNKLYTACLKKKSAWANQIVKWLGQVRMKKQSITI